MWSCVVCECPLRYMSTVCTEIAKTWNGVLPLFSSYFGKNFELGLGIPKWIFFGLCRIKYGSKAKKIQKTTGQNNIFHFILHFSNHRMYPFPLFLLLFLLVEFLPEASLVRHNAGPIPWSSTCHARPEFKHVNGSLGLYGNRSSQMIFLIEQIFKLN